jgi:hypothetical protein
MNLETIWIGVKAKCSQPYCGHKGMEVWFDAIEQYISLFNKESIVGSLYIIEYMYVRNKI